MNDLNLLIEKLAAAQREGKLDDDRIEAYAQRYARVIGRYRYQTDPEERPEGLTDLDERVQSVLKGRRKRDENERRKGKHGGMANFGGGA